MARAQRVREDEAGELTLALLVQAGAKRTEVLGAYGEGAARRLRLRLGAPAVDGKANAELARFLAIEFGVAPRAVVLLRGATSRWKTVRIEAPRLRPDRVWLAGGGREPR